MQNYSLIKKWTAAFVIVTQLATMSPENVHAGQLLPSGTAPSMALNINALQVSEKLGKVQIRQKGNSAKTLILIEDAHSSSAAQQSIQNLITGMQSEYRIPTVLLEGIGFSPNLALEQSFPDWDWLKSAIDSDVASQNISGGAAALFLSNSAQIESAEEQEFYFRAVQNYLNASRRQAQVLAGMRHAESVVQRTKQKIYPKESLVLDQLLEQDSSTGLVRVLSGKQIFDLSQASHLRAASKIIRQTRIFSKPLFKKFWLKILMKWADEMNKGSSLRGAERRSNLKLSQIATPSGRARDDMQSEKIQALAVAEDFRMGRISAEESARKIDQSVPVESLKSLSPLEKEACRFVMKTAFAQTTLDVSALDDEYQKLVVRELSRTFTKSAQKVLLAQTLRIRLLKKLVKMELSRSEWERVSRFKLRHDDWNIFTDFYHVQDQREAVMQKKISQAFKKNDAVILVAGGFHRKGIEAAAQVQGWNIMTVTPAILDLKGTERYADLMHGQVAWRSEMKAENGSVDLRRAYWTYLLKKYEREKPAETYDLLCNWRRNLIFKLSEKGQLGQAQKELAPLNHFLAEWLPETEKSRLRKIWQERLHAFSEKIKLLRSKNNLNPETIAAAIKPPSMVVPVVMNPFASVPASLILPQRKDTQGSVLDGSKATDGTGPYAPVASRSEKLVPNRRSEMRPEKVNLDKLHADEVSTSKPDLSDLFGGERTKVAAAIKAEIERAARGKEEVTVRGINFILRRKARMPVWAFKKKNSDAFRRAFEVATVLNEEQELAISRRGMIDLLGQRDWTKRVLNINAFVDRQPGGDFEKTVRHNSVEIRFFRRLSTHGSPWAINRADAEKLKEMLGLFGEATEDEIVISGANFFNEFGLQQIDKVREIEKELNSKKNKKSLAVDWQGITFFRRYSGHRPSWVVERAQRADFITKFKIDDRADIQAMGANEYALSDNGMSEAFDYSPTEKKYREVIVALDKKAAAHKPSLREVEFGGVIFRLRYARVHQVWTFSKEDKEKVRVLLGLLKPLAKGEVAVSLPSLTAYTRSPKVLLGWLNGQLPDFATSEKDETVFEKISFFKRRNGPAFVWAFNGADLFRLLELRNTRFGKPASRAESSGAANAEAGSAGDGKKWGSKEKLILLRFQPLRQALGHADFDIPTMEKKLNAARGDKTEVEWKGVIYHWTQRGTNSFWGITENDLERFAESWNLASRGPDDEVGISRANMAAVKYDEIISTLEKAAKKSIKVELGGITYRHRIIAKHWMWTYPESQEALFNQTWGVVNFDQLPVFSPRNDIAITGRDLALEFPGDRVRDMVRIQTFLDDAAPGGEQFEYNGILFTRKRRSRAFFWTISKKVKELFQQTFKIFIKLKPDEVPIIAGQLASYFQGRRQQVSEQLVQILDGLVTEDRQLEVEYQGIKFIRRMGTKWTGWAVHKNEMPKIVALYPSQKELRQLQQKEDPKKKIRGQIEAVIDGLVGEDLHGLAIRYGREFEEIVWQVLGAENEIDREMLHEVFSEILIEKINSTAPLGNTAIPTMTFVEGVNAEPMPKGADKSESNAPHQMDTPLTQDEIRDLAGRFESILGKPTAHAGLQSLVRQQAVNVIKALEEQYFFQKYYRDEKEKYQGDEAFAEIENVLEKEKNALTRDALAHFLEEVDEAIQFEKEIHKKGLKKSTRLDLYQGIASVRMLKERNMILADQMGVGKTLQAISTFLASDEREMAVFGPKLILSRWVEDLANHTDVPLEIVALVGKDKFKEFQAVLDGIPGAKGRIKLVTLENGESYDYLLNARAVPSAGTRRVILMNYQRLPNLLERKVQKKPQAVIEFPFLVLDEFQLLKNSGTQSAEVVFGNGVTGFRANRKLLLSGTPLENKISDLFSGLAFLSTQETGPEAELFQSLTRQSFSTLFSTQELGRLAQLHAYLTRKMIRRLKIHVLSGLPEKIEKTFSLNPWSGVMVESRDGNILSKTELPGDYRPQRELYDSYLYYPVETEAELRALRKNAVSSADDEEVEAENPAGKITQVLRLEQAMLDPAQLGMPADSIKFDAAVQILDDRVKKQKSSFLVVTNFRGSAEAFRLKLSKQGYATQEIGLIVGTTPPDERRQIMALFQAGKIKVLIATTASIELGIELTRADGIMFLNHPWKPSTREQVIDRAHRRDPQRNYPGRQLEVISLEIDLPVSIDKLKRQVLRRKEILSQMVIDGQLAPEILKVFRGLDNVVMRMIERVSDPMTLDEYEKTIQQQFLQLLGQALATRDVGKLSKIWDEMAVLYLEILEHKGSFFANMASLQYLSERFPDLGKNGKINALDLGSGPSTLKRAYERNRPGLAAKKFLVEVTDYDLSRNMLALGKQGSARQIQGSMDDLEKVIGEKAFLKPESFELVNLSYALSYVKHPANLIRQIQKLLKKDGIFTLILPAKTEISEAFFAGLEKAGFQVITGREDGLQSTLSEGEFQDLVREYGVEFAKDAARTVRTKVRYIVAQKNGKQPGEITDANFKIGRHSDYSIDKSKIQKLIPQGDGAAFLPAKMMVDGHLVGLAKIQGSDESEEARALPKIRAAIARVQNIQAAKQVVAALDKMMQELDAQEGFLTDESRAVAKQWLERLLENTRHREKILGSSYRVSISDRIKKLSSRSEIRIDDLARVLREHPYIRVYDPDHKEESLFDFVPDYQKMLDDLKERSIHPEEGMQKIILADVREVSRRKMIGLPEERWEGFFEEVSPETGEPTGKVVSYSYKYQHAVFYRAVLVIVMDERGRMLIQRRKFLEGYPVTEDASVTGHDDIGMTPRETAAQESLEEAGIAASPQDLIEVKNPETGKFFWVDRNEPLPRGDFDNALRYVFVLKISSSKMDSYHSRGPIYKDKVFGWRVEPYDEVVKRLADPAYLAKVEPSLRVVRKMALADVHIPKLLRINRSEIRQDGVNGDSERRPQPGEMKIFLQPGANKYLNPFEQVDLSLKDPSQKSEVLSQLKSLQGQFLASAENRSRQTFFDLSTLPIQSIKSDFEGFVQRYFKNPEPIIAKFHDPVLAPLKISLPEPELVLIRLTQFAQVLNRSETRIKGVDRSSPMSFFLNAFGIDPLQAEISFLGNDWGRVELAQHSILGLEGEGLRKEVFESLQAVMGVEHIREYLGGKDQVGQLQDLKKAYLLTYKNLPAAIVWPDVDSHDGKKVLVYDLLNPSQANLMLPSEASGALSVDRDFYHSNLPKFLAGQHHVNSFDVIEPLLTSDGRVVAKMLVHENEKNQVWFPSVYPPGEFSSIKTAGYLRGQVRDKKIDLSGQAAVDVGSGAGTNSALLFDMGAEEVHAVDISLLKLMNTAYQVRVWAKKRGADFGKLKFHLHLRSFPKADFYMLNSPNYSPNEKVQAGYAGADMANTDLSPNDLHSIFSAAAEKANDKALFLVRMYYHTVDEESLRTMLVGAQSNWKLKDEATERVFPRRVDDDEFLLTPYHPNERKETIFTLERRPRSEMREPMAELLKRSQPIFLDSTGKSLTDVAAVLREREAEMKGLDLDELINILINRLDQAQDAELLSKLLYLFLFIPWQVTPGFDYARAISIIRNVQARNIILSDLPNYIEHLLNVLLLTVLLNSKEYELAAKVGLKDKKAPWIFGANAAGFIKEKPAKEAQQLLDAYRREYESAANTEERDAVSVRIDALAKARPDLNYLLIFDAYRKVFDYEKMTVLLPFINIDWNELFSETMQKIRDCPARLGRYKDELAMFAGDIASFARKQGKPIDLSELAAIVYREAALDFMYGNDVDIRDVIGRMPHSAMRRLLSKPGVDEKLLEKYIGALWGTHDMDDPAAVTRAPSVGNQSGCMRDQIRRTISEVTVRELYHAQQLSDLTAFKKVAEKLADLFAAIPHDPEREKFIFYLLKRMVDESRGYPQPEDNYHPLSDNEIDIFAAALAEHPKLRELVSQKYEITQILHSAWIEGEQGELGSDDGFGDDGTGGRSEMRDDSTANANDFVLAPDDSRLVTINKKRPILFPRKTDAGERRGNLPLRDNDVTLSPMRPDLIAWLDTVLNIQYKIARTQLLNRLQAANIYSRSDLDRAYREYRLKNILAGSKWLQPILTALRSEIRMSWNLDTIVGAAVWLLLAGVYLSARVLERKTKKFFDYPEKDWRRALLSSESFQSFFDSKKHQPSLGLNARGLKSLTGQQLEMRVIFQLIQERLQNDGAWRSQSIIKKATYINSAGAGLFWVEIRNGGGRNYFIFDLNKLLSSEADPVLKQYSSTRWKPLSFKHDARGITVQSGYFFKKTINRVDLPENKNDSGFHAFDFSYLDRSEGLNEIRHKLSKVEFAGLEMWVGELNDPAFVKYDPQEVEWKLWTHPHGEMSPASNLQTWRESIAAFYAIQDRLVGHNQTLEYSTVPRFLIGEVELQDDPEHEGRRLMTLHPTLSDGRPGSPRSVSFTPESLFGIWIDLAQKKTTLIFGGIDAKHIQEQLGFSENTRVLVVPSIKTRSESRSGGQHDDVALAGLNVLGDDELNRIARAAGAGIDFEYLSELAAAAEELHIVISRMNDEYLLQKNIHPDYVEGFEGAGYFAVAGGKTDPLHAFMDEARIGRLLDMLSFAQHVSKKISSDQLKKNMDRLKSQKPWSFYSLLRLIGQRDSALYLASINRFYRAYEKIESLDMENLMVSLKETFSGEDQFFKSIEDVWGDEWRRILNYLEHLETQFETQKSNEDRINLIRTRLAALARNVGPEFADSLQIKAVGRERFILLAENEVLGSVLLAKWGKHDPLTFEKWNLAALIETQPFLRSELRIFFKTKLKSRQAAIQRALDEGQFDAATQKAVWGLINKTMESQAYANLTNQEKLDLLTIYVQGIHYRPAMSGIPKLGPDPFDEIKEINEWIFKDRVYSPDRRNRKKKQPWPKKFEKKLFPLTMKLLRIPQIQPWQACSTAWLFLRNALESPWSDLQMAESERFIDAVLKKAPGDAEAILSKIDYIVLFYAPRNWSSEDYLRLWNFIHELLNDERQRVKLKRRLDVIHRVVVSGAYQGETVENQFAALRFAAALPLPVSDNSSDYYPFDVWSDILLPGKSDSYRPELIAEQRLPLRITAVNYLAKILHAKVYSYDDFKRWWLVEIPKMLKDLPASESRRVLPVLFLQWLWWRNKEERHTIFEKMIREMSDPLHEKDPVFNHFVAALRTHIVQGYLKTREPGEWFHYLVMLRDLPATPTLFSGRLFGFLRQWDMVRGQVHGVLPGHFSQMLVQYLGYLPAWNSHHPGDSELLRKIRATSMQPLELIYTNSGSMLEPGFTLGKIQNHKKEFSNSLANLWLVNDLNQAPRFVVKGEAWRVLGLSESGGAAYYLHESTGLVVSICINTTRTRLEKVQQITRSSLAGWKNKTIPFDRLVQIIVTLAPDIREQVVQELIQQGFFKTDEVKKLRAASQTPSDESLLSKIRATVEQYYRDDPAGAAIDFPRLSSGNLKSWRFNFKISPSGYAFLIPVFRQWMGTEDWREETIAAYLNAVSSDIVGGGWLRLPMIHSMLVVLKQMPPLWHPEDGVSHAWALEKTSQSLDLARPFKQETMTKAEILEGIQQEMGILFREEEAAWGHSPGRSMAEAEKIIDKSRSEMRKDKTVWDLVWARALKKLDLKESEKEWEYTGIRFWRHLFPVLAFLGAVFYVAWGFIKNDSLFYKVPAVLSLALIATGSVPIRIYYSTVKSWNDLKKIFKKMGVKISDASLRAAVWIGNAKWSENGGVWSLEFDPKPASGNYHYLRDDVLKSILWFFAKPEKREIAFKALREQIPATADVHGRKWFNSAKKLHFDGVLNDVLDHERLRRLIEFWGDSIPILIRQEILTRESNTEHRKELLNYQGERSAEMSFSDDGYLMAHYEPGVFHFLTNGLSAWVIRISIFSLWCYLLVGIIHGYQSLRWEDYLEGFLVTGILTFLLSHVRGMVLRHLFSAPVNMQIGTVAREDNSENEIQFKIDAGAGLGVETMGLLLSAMFYSANGRKIRRWIRDGKIKIEAKGPNEVLGFNWNFLFSRDGDYAWRYPLRDTSEFRITISKEITGSVSENLLNLKTRSEMRIMLKKFKQEFAAAFKDYFKDDTIEWNEDKAGVLQLQIDIGFEGKWGWKHASSKVGSSRKRFDELGKLLITQFPEYIFDFGSRTKSDDPINSVIQVLFTIRPYTTLYSQARLDPDQARRKYNINLILRDSEKAVPALGQSVTELGLIQGLAQQLLNLSMDERTAMMLGMSSGEDVLLQYLYRLSADDLLQELKRGTNRTRPEYFTEKMRPALEAMGLGMLLNKADFDRLQIAFWATLDEFDLEIKPEGKNLQITAKQPQLLEPALKALGVFGLEQIVPDAFDRITLPPHSALLRDKTNLFHFWVSRQLSSEYKKSLILMQNPAEWRYLSGHFDRLNAIRLSNQFYKFRSGQYGREAIEVSLVKNADEHFYTTNFKFNVIKFNEAKRHFLLEFEPSESRPSRQKQAVANAKAALTKAMHQLGYTVEIQDARRSEIRKSVMTAFEKFGIHIDEDGTIDYSQVPLNVDWVMDGLRDREKAPLAGTLIDLPEVKLVHRLEDYPIIAGGTHELRLVIVNVNGREFPAVFKKGGAALDFNQIYERTGAGPRFYGSARNKSKGLPVGYAIQLVIGETYKLDRRDLAAEDKDAFYEMSGRLKEAGLGYPKEVIRVDPERGNAVIAIDADDAMIADVSAFEAFQKKMSRSESRVSQLQIEKTNQKSVNWPLIALGFADIPADFQMPPADVFEITPEMEPFLFEAFAAKKSEAMVDVQRNLDKVSAKQKFDAGLTQLTQAVQAGQIVKLAPVIFYSEDIHEQLIQLVLVLQKAFENRTQDLNVSIVFSDFNDREKFEEALRTVSTPGNQLRRLPGVSQGVNLYWANNQDMGRLRRNVIESKNWSDAAGFFFAPQFFIQSLKPQARVRAVRAGVLPNSAMMSFVPGLTRYFGTASVINAQTLAQFLAGLAPHMHLDLELGWSFLDSILSVFAITQKSVAIAA